MARSLPKTGSTGWAKMRRRIGSVPPSRREPTGIAIKHSARRRVRQHRGQRASGPNSIRIGIYRRQAVRGLDLRIARGLGGTPARRARTRSGDAGRIPRAPLPRVFSHRDAAPDRSGNALIHQREIDIALVQRDRQLAQRHSPRGRCRAQALRHRLGQTRLGFAKAGNSSARSTPRSASRSNSAARRFSQAGSSAPSWPNLNAA
jgi:hypothetical protein